MNLPASWRVYKPERRSRRADERGQGEAKSRSGKDERQIRHNKGPVYRMRTAVVVLGDLGRSPRMQYHALAAAVNDGAVDLVGLEGAPVHAALTAEPRLRSHRLSDRAFRSRTGGGVGRFVLFSAARASSQAARLLTALLRLPKPDVILVQNPPAFPTLSVAWLVARLRGAKLVIDWHNLSHTILAVRLGGEHRAVRALARSEARWARRADAHLAVSASLAEWLRREWGIAATVVYDRPPSFFAKPDLAAAAELWQRVARDLNLGARRIPLVVCPTSWTPDEDFDLLLEALERTERKLVELRGAPVEGPDLALLMTGRGALREEFERRLARRNLKRIAVRTAWLEPGDYPVLVGMADAGLCLHQSSSGLDLPMKLADFRGAGVPACAYDYSPVLAEVLRPGLEGVTFRDPGELSALLVALATADLARVPKFAASRVWLAQNPPERWEQQWTEKARPVLAVV
jgi:beta-1,4-mannosyltransferase